MFLLLRNIYIEKIDKVKKTLFGLIVLIIYSMDLYGQIHTIDSSIQQKHLPFSDTSSALINTGISKLPQKKITKDSSKKVLELHGTILIEGQYATRNYNYQQVPQNYLRTTVTPQLSLWGIPFTSRINLSTEQFKVNYNLNRLSFSLDINKLNNLLLKQLKGKVNDSLNYEKINKQMWQDSLQKLNVDEILVTAKKIADDKKKELTDLQKQLPQSPTGEYDSLLATDLRYRRVYQNYLSKQREYEENLNALDSLEELKKRYDKLKKQYDKLNNAKAFEPDKINASTVLPDKYKSHPLLTKTEKFLLSIRSFGIGTINPPSGQSYLQGSAINGVSIENGFGKLFTSLQAGLLQQNLIFSELKQYTSKKYLYAAKVGWGMPEDAHIHFGYTKSGIIGRSHSTAVETAIQTPENISIGSVDAKIPIRQNFFVFGNWAIADVKGFGIESISHGETQQGNPRQASISDFLMLPNTYYTTGINGDFQKTKTKIIAQTTRIGTSFYSPLNPYLRNDVLKNEVRLTQKLWKDYVSGSLNYSTSQDNLLHQKSATTRIDNYKASLSVRLKRLPSLIASYAVINQNTVNKEVSTFKYQNRTEILTVTSVYSRRINKNVLTGSLTYMQQNIINITVAGLNRQYNNLTGNITISDIKGNSILYTSTYTTLNGVYKNHVLNNQVEAIYTCPKNTSYISSAGVFYTTDNLLGNTGGVFIKQSISFWEKSIITLMARQNFYNNTYSNKTLYQTIINIQLLQQW